MRGKKTFSGPFKNYILSYIDYKKKLGFKCGETREYRLNSFDEFAKNKNINTIDLNLIYDYINSQDVSNNTKATITSTLRDFTKYLYNENISDFVLPNKIYICKRTHKPYIFTNEEIERFFDVAKEFYPNCKFKNDIILLCFLLLYCTGMRIGECLSIRFKDVDFENNVITIYNTKNNIDRNLVVNDYLITKLKYIKKEYSDKYIDNDYIFIRVDGTRLIPSSIYAIFKKIIYYARIGQEGKSPRVHDFRFTFCCKCYHKIIGLQNCQEYIPVLSAYVGHKDFKSTEYYLSLVSELYPEIREKIEVYTNDLIRELEDIDE